MIYNAALNLLFYPDEAESTNQMKNTISSLAALALLVITLLPTPGNTGECPPVTTTAQNPETGTKVDFPTICDVPKGWKLICIKMETTAKNPATGTQITFPSTCDVPTTWEIVDRSGKRIVPAPPKPVKSTEAQESKKLWGDFIPEDDASPKLICIADDTKLSHHRIFIDVAQQSLRFILINLENTAESTTELFYATLVTKSRIEAEEAMVQSDGKELKSLVIDLLPGTFLYYRYVEADDDWIKMTGMCRAAKSP